jgi:hypothetical protein
MREFAELQVETWTVRVGCQAGIALAFAVVLTFLAPFGTDRYPTFALIGYWTLCMAAWPVLVAGLGRPLARRIGAPVGSLRSLASSTLVASLPMLGVTVAATLAISDWKPGPSELAEQLAGIWLIGGAYSYLCDRVLGTMLASPAIKPTAVPGLVAEPDDTVADSEATKAAVLEDAFFNRLPLNIGRDLTCLQVEDHYVRVHTRLGSALVLMRFSDALVSLSAERGLRVHRSWWVAFDAVTGMQRAGRTAELTLSNGIVVPVSQPYLADVNQMWKSNAA